MDLFFDLVAVLTPDEWSLLESVATVVTLFAAAVGFALKVFFSVRAASERRYAKAVLANFKPEAMRNRRKVFGRDTEVAALRTALLASGKSAVVPVQTGGGGIGKTTLCKHYALVHAKDYDHVEFLRASSETELVTDLAALAKRLDPTLDEAEGIRALAIRARDFINARAAQQNWLVIFDNVEAPQLMLDWGVRAGRLHVLVTSRFPDWAAEGFAARPLGVLKPDPAVAVLKNESERDEDGFADLAKDLGYLPLALVQAGEWLRAHPAQSTGAYLTKVDNLRRRVNVPGLKMQQDRTTAAVVELTLQSLSRDARALADVLAWYAPDKLSEALFAGLSPVSWSVRMQDAILRYVPARILDLADDVPRRQAACAELRQVALLEDADEATNAHRMHRVFQVVIRSQVNVRRRAGFVKARAAAASLAAQFQFNPDLVIHWPACRRLVPHVQALWATADPLWRDPWQQPDWPAMDYLLSQAGLFLSIQQDLSGAIALKTAALMLKEKRLGEDDRDVPPALGNLALDLADTGAFDAAEAKIDRAVKLDKTYRTGPEREDLAARYMQQATIALRRMQARGDGTPAAAARADTALHQARRIRTELFTAKSLQMAHCWNETGYLRGLQGRKWDERDAYAQAYQITKAFPDADHADLAARAMNFGATALELGEPELALDPLQRAYDLAVKVYAEVPNHGYFVETQKWLAACQFVLGRKGQDGMRQAALDLCQKHGLNAAEREARTATLPLNPIPRDPPDPDP
jgi:tetratricopeptide (TPR) repeat protein